MLTTAPLWACSNDEPDPPEPENEMFGTIKATLDEVDLSTDIVD